MTQPSVPASNPVDLNKAFGAAGSAVVGGAVVTILIHILKIYAPNFLDPETVGAIQTIILAGMAYLGAWLTPHSKG